MNGRTVRKNVAVGILILATVFALGGCAADSGKGGWKNLYNDKKLVGFRQLGGNAVYSVSDGIITGRSVKGTPNSFLCTKKNYGDFELEFDVKVDERLNSGVQIRSQSTASYKNGRVHGYQVEIDPSNRAWSGGIYDEARREWLDDLKDNEPARKAFVNGQWNHYRVLAVGDSIKTWVNGVAAADLVDSMDSTGFIGLQVHSTKSEQPSMVQWRNLRIKDLGEQVWRPLFDGRSLKGWHSLPGGKWVVVDGVIVGTSDKEEPRHGLLVSDDVFDDFTIRLKFKAIEGNSGFYFRCDEVKGIVGVHGFQAEIATSEDIGGLYETGGRAWVIKPTHEQVAKYFKPQQWNQMTVSAHGRRIVVHVNGTKTAELKNDPGRLKGRLALQLHGSKQMHVMFKDVEILLPKRGAAERL